MPRWAEIQALRPGVIGTSDSVRQMWRIVEQDKLDPLVLKIAHYLRLSAGRDRNAQLSALFDWLKHRMAYVTHTHQVQRLESIRETMERIAALKAAGAYAGPAVAIGDCPHFSMAVAAIGGALGFPAAFETVKVDPARPDEFTHIYGALWVPGREWVPLDASTEEATLGWRPPVSPDRLRRWPEPEIESVLTPADLEKARRMNENGHGMNGALRAMGLGEDTRRVDPEIYPPEFQKLWPERRTGESVFETPRPEYAENWFPKEPAIPEGEVEYDSEMLKNAPQVSPSSRLPYDAEMLRAEQRPFYRDPRPGVQIRVPYYATSPFQDQVELQEGPNGEMLRQVSPHYSRVVSGVSRGRFVVPGHDWSKKIDILDARVDAPFVEGQMAGMGMGEYAAMSAFVADRLVDVTSRRVEVLREACQAAQGSGDRARAAICSNMLRGAQDELRRAIPIRARERERLAAAAKYLQPPRPRGMGADDTFTGSFGPGETMSKLPVAAPAPAEQPFAGSFSLNDAAPAPAAKAVTPAAEADVWSKISGVLNSVTAGFSTATKALTAAAITPTAAAVIAKAPVPVAKAGMFDQVMDAAIQHPFIATGAAAAIGVTAYRALSPKKRSRGR